MEHVECIADAAIAALCGVVGEHTAIMLRALRSSEVAGTAWLEPFTEDFRARLLALLPGAFRYLIHLRHEPSWFIFRTNNPCHAC